MTSTSVEAEAAAYLEWLENPYFVAPQTDLTATDLFCGGGGSSTGMEMAGVAVSHAANHSALAIEVHSMNFPRTDHSLVDISDANPRFFPKTDILWASPECTNHSQAKRHKRTSDLLFGDDGVDIPAERSRVMMNDVPRFMEAARMRNSPYKYVVVENVVEISQWLGFNDWCRDLANLGYSFEVLSLNSMSAHGRSGVGTPQSRDRVYVVCWDSQSGVPRPNLDIRPPAYCDDCGDVVDAVQTWKNPRTHVGRYRAQYEYRCPNLECFEVVQPLALPSWPFLEWDAPTEAIGDRFAAKARNQVIASIARYGSPVTASVDHQGQKGVVPAWRMSTLLRRIGAPVGLGASQQLLVPAITTSAGKFRSERGYNPYARRLAEAARKATTTSNPKPIVIDRGVLGLPGGFVLRNYSARGDLSQMGSPFVEPVRTITAKGNQSVVTVPWRELGNVSSFEQLFASGQAPIAVTEELVRHCSARPITSNESQRLMGFPGSYRVSGGKSERLRLFGNAVTPPAASLIMERCVEAIYPEILRTKGSTPGRSGVELSL